MVFMRRRISAKVLGWLGLFDVHLARALDRGRADLVAAGSPKGKPEGLTGSHIPVILS
jgi:hypothetical protein